MESKVIAILKELGISMGNLGFSYIKEALLMISQNEANLHSITAPYGLYGVIAKKNSTTPSRVERAMRHAIESMFLHCNTETLYKYFGNTPDLKSGKLTNKNFIAILAEELKIGEDTAEHRVIQTELAEPMFVGLSEISTAALIEELRRRVK